MSKKELFKKSAYISLAVSGFSAAFTVTSVITNSNSPTLLLLLFAFSWPMTLVLTAGLAALKYLEQMNPLNNIADGLKGDE